MFYIPAGILASLNPAYVAKAEEAYGITAEQIATLTPLHSLANFIPVTLGNMLGGMIFVGLPLYLIYKKKLGNEKKEPETNQFQVLQRRRPDLNR
mgnify:FL=1